MSPDSHLRIGELSRRSGVSPELLRAWERRYGLLRPTRSPGGLRLYSDEDLARVRLMARHIADGLAAREAAALAARAELSGTAPRALHDGGATAFDPDAAQAELMAATEAFDEPRAQTLLDELLRTATVDSVLSSVVIPFLREIGERWARGELSVGHEHFASNLLRGRLLGLARGWGRGNGPRALLACPPGEAHDLGLVAFGVALRARGWRIDFLGADTPADSLFAAAAALDPALVVVSAATPAPLEAFSGELERLARDHRVAVSGAGAERWSNDSVELLVLRGDPVSEAEQVSATLGS